MVWENYYYTRITYRREKELKVLKYNSYVYLVWIFVIWVCPIIGVVCMLICQAYTSTDLIIVENMVVFLKIYFLIIEAMFAIPSCIEYLGDIKSSMNKIREFLKLSEIDVNISPNKYVKRKLKVPSSKLGKTNYPIERSNELMKNSSGVFNTNLVTKKDLADQSSEQFLNEETPKTNKPNKWNQEFTKSLTSESYLSPELALMKENKINTSKNTDPYKFKNVNFKLKNFEIDLNNGNFIMIYFSNKDPLRKNYVTEI